MTPLQAPDPLAALRPIHLPEPIGWWPPAPGWWLLGLLTLVAMAGWIGFRRRNPGIAPKLTKETARRQLLSLDRETTDDARFLARLNRHMKSLAIHCHGNTVAPLSGEAWLRFLDTGSDGRPFTHGAGRILALGPYQRRIDGLDRRALLEICIDWLQRQEALP